VAYSVITIARTLGAGGEDIGRSLAAEYGMRYVDGEIIERAAQLAGVTPGEVGRAEARKGLMERIFENIARSGGAFGEYVPDPSLLAAPGYEELIVDVIRETAEAGNAVIVAHGAAIPLARMNGVLRVLVTASPQTRAARLNAEAHGELRAKKMVEESDAARADFFRRFYGVQAENATHYDLVINTNHLSGADAAAVIRSLQT